MEDILVNSLLAALESGVDLVKDVIGKSSDVFEGVATSAEGSSESFGGSTDAAFGSYEIIDQIG